MHLYLFDHGYGGTGLCNDDTNEGQTDTFRTASTITLCPQGFTGTSSRSYNWIYKSLREKTPQPITINTLSAAPTIWAVPENVMLHMFVSTATVLFHELFHLVNQPLAVPKSGGELYELADLLKIPFDIASRNPESYNMAAYAYDYTLHTLQDEEGSYIEFFTGYATIGL